MKHKVYLRFKNVLKAQGYTWDVENYKNLQIYPKHKVQRVSETKKCT